MGLMPGVRGLDTDSVSTGVSTGLSLAAVRFEPYTVMVGAVPAACMAPLICQLTGTPLEGTAGLGASECSFCAQELTKGSL